MPLLEHRFRDLIFSATLRVSTGEPARSNTAIVGEPCSQPTRMIATKVMAYSKKGMCIEMRETCICQAQSDLCIVHGFEQYASSTLNLCSQANKSASTHALRSAPSFPLHPCLITSMQHPTIHRPPLSLPLARSPPCLPTTLWPLETRPPRTLISPSHPFAYQLRPKAGIHPCASVPYVQASVKSEW